MDKVCRAVNFHLDTVQWKHICLGIRYPKKQLSDTFIAKIPSLNDLFLSYESQEEEIISTAEESLSSIIKLNDKIKEARLDLLKTEKPDWEQQQKTKESLQKIQEQIENFQKLNDKLNQLNSQGDKHDLFSDEMMFSN